LKIRAENERKARRRKSQKNSTGKSKEAKRCSKNGSGIGVFVGGGRTKMGGQTQNNNLRTKRGRILEVSARKGQKSQSIPETGKITGGNRTRKVSSSIPHPFPL